LFTLPIVLGLLCTLVSASVVGTLDSTLDLRLSAVPLVFSATQVSSTFTASSLFGSAVSLPLAFLVNHISGSYRLLSFVTAIGFLVVGLAFLLLAPLGSAVLRMPGSWTLAAPNSVEAVYVAMILKSVGNGLGMLSMYPAMVLNVPDDPYLESRLAAMNSALYSFGWCVGPLLGSALFAAFSDVILCMPGEEEGCQSNMRCSCEWQPNNGYDGQASTVGLLSISFAMLLALAGCFNIGAKRTRDSAARVQSEESVKRRRVLASTPASASGLVMSGIAHIKATAYHIDAPASAARELSAPVRLSRYLPHKPSALKRSFTSGPALLRGSAASPSKRSSTRHSIGVWEDAIEAPLGGSEMMGEVAVI